MSFLEKGTLTSTSVGFEDVAFSSDDNSPDEEKNWPGFREWFDASLFWNDANSTNSRVPKPALKPYLLAYQCFTGKFGGLANFQWQPEFEEIQLQFYHDLCLQMICSSPLFIKFFSAPFPSDWTHHCYSLVQTTTRQTMTCFPLHVSPCEILDPRLIKDSKECKTDNTSKPKDGLTNAKRAPLISAACGVKVKQTSSCTPNCCVICSLLSFLNASSKHSEKGSPIIRETVRDTTSTKVKDTTTKGANPPTSDVLSDTMEALLASSFSSSSSSSLSSSSSSFISSGRSVLGSTNQQTSHSIKRSCLQEFTKSNFFRCWQLRRYSLAPLPAPFNQDTYCFQSRQIVKENMKHVERQRLLFGRDLSKSKTPPCPSTGVHCMFTDAAYNTFLPSSLLDLELFSNVETRKNPKFANLSKARRLQLLKWVQLRQDALLAEWEHRDVSPTICILDGATQVKMIPESDPRPALRGQRGLFASRTIYPGEIIHFYRQLVIRCTNKDNSCFFGDEEEKVNSDSLSSRLQEDHSRILSKANFDEFSYSLQEYFRIPSSALQMMNDRESKNHYYDIVGTGWGVYGNNTRYINDCRIDPLTMVASKRRHDVATRANCKFYATRYQTTRIHIECIKLIPAGAELLIDYGETFWRPKRDAEKLLNSRSWHVS